MAAALIAALAGMAVGTASGLASAGPKPKVIRALQHDTSAPLRAMHGASATGTQQTRVPGHKSTPTASPPATSVVSGDPVLQQTPPAAVGPALAGSFEGIGAGIPGYFVGYMPSDVNGAIGTNHYVQIANAAVAVFDRSGTLLLGPEPISTLWTGFGGLCETTNGGDPIVLYDQSADRWLISQLAYSGANGTSVPYLNCIAVSTTADPTGAYFRYAFPRSDLPDYTKLSVWPDAYYLTDNEQQNGNFFTGAAYAALDRASMLAGGPATMIVFSLGQNYSSLLPAGQDGPTAPPPGAPGYALALGADQASLDLWRLHVDFAAPVNSTLSGPFNIPVAPFRELCGGFASCVPQAAPGGHLASLGDRLMYRVAYRNFGDHESLVASHSVDPGQGGSSSGGLRWYEVRNPGGTPSLYQQGTFAPDSNYRWMGSVAMDARGDLAAGYSLSGINVAPSIALTGRLAGDPLGTLAQGETFMVAGTGVQLPVIDRWGDYTSMAVDPVDDCTFWYTNQYLTVNGTNVWHTRVGSFRYPSCALAPSSTNLTSTPNPSTGGPVTLTATVTGSGLTPTGAVTFQDGNAVLGTATLSGGQAAVSVGLLGGIRSLAAVYSGDSTYSGSSSPLIAQTVNLPATSTTLTASTASSSAAGAVTFTATVTGNGTTTGTITFFADGLNIGSSTLSAGSAGFTTSGLPVGSNNVTAIYSGDTANASSISGAVSVSVSGPSYSPLFNFTGGSTDNGDAQEGLTEAPDGAFYGVTDLGNTGTWGTIFRFTPATGVTTLHTFVTAEGSGPHCKPLLGADGALYGTNAGLSGSGGGQVWRITTQGAYSVLHVFNGTDGYNPAGSLVQDSAGNLYGVTIGGGLSDRGTVYALSASGTLTTLYSFSGGVDGNGPTTGLVFGPDGNLYGVTSGGGGHNAGTVFRISTAGALTTLYSFTGGADGVGPSSALLLGADGNFYGTTFGGAMGRGTIYRISPAGTFATIYELSPGDGSAPVSGLVQDAMGNLYGETERTDPGSLALYGTLFELTPSGTFVRLRLMDFHTGANPAGGLTLARDGNLYGTDSSGGANTWGVIFSLTLATTLTLTPAALSNLVEGNSASLVVAQLSGGVAPFTASINWGDGTTSAGNVTSGGAVTGTHTWAEETAVASPDIVTVTVTDSRGQTATTTDSASVTDASLTAGSPVAIGGSENSLVNGAVATFSDANAAAPSSDFTASISWGDGSTSVGTVSGSGPFTVSGTHTYAEGGSYAITTTVIDRGGSTLTAGGTAAITDFALSATGITTNAKKSFSGTVAKLSDADSTVTISEYSVTIDWGDGTSSSGLVSGKKSPFLVTGSHTYLAGGVYTVTVHVRDAGGATATAVSKLTVH